MGACVFTGLCALLSCYNVDVGNYMDCPGQLQQSKDCNQYFGIQGGCCTSNGCCQSAKQIDCVGDSGIYTGNNTQCGGPVCTESPTTISPTTTTPTTFLPTTATPTTLTPTTSIPTSYSPTTTIPTTTVPTTITPTTTSPTTSTFNPTTSKPTEEPESGIIFDITAKVTDKYDKSNIGAEDNNYLVLITVIVILTFIIIVLGIVVLILVRTRNSSTGNSKIEMIKKGAEELVNIGEIQLACTNEGNNDAMENENKSNDVHMETAGRWYSPEQGNEKQEDDIYSDEMNGVENVIKKEDKWKHAYHVQKTPQHEESIHNVNNNKQKVTIGNNSAQITNGDELLKGDSDNNNNST